VREGEWFWKSGNPILDPRFRGDDPVPLTKFGYGAGTFDFLPTGKRILNKTNYSHITAVGEIK